LQSSHCSTYLHPLTHSTALRCCVVLVVLSMTGSSLSSVVVSSLFSAHRGGNSTHILLICGVPQGTVFGSILCLLYIVDLLQLIGKHLLDPDLYANDTLIYGSCYPEDTSKLHRKYLSITAVFVCICRKSHRNCLNPVPKSPVPLSNKQHSFVVILP